MGDGTKIFFDETMNRDPREIRCYVWSDVIITRTCDIFVFGMLYMCSYPLGIRIFRGYRLMGKLSALCTHRNHQTMEG